jgi:chemotaxis protein MotC
MMIKLARIVLAALPVLPGYAMADDVSAQPTAQIRALTRQFDKIANRGSSSAAGLGEARDQYGNYLRDAAASESKSQELREHAELFVLSGGDVSVLAPWGEGLEPNSKEKKLFDGIMAYGRGRTAEAESILLSLDPTSFDALRGGHLSLTQALLTSRVNPERAFEYFEKARLLLPGTLVEEAALRQIVVLAAKTSNRDRFLNAAISYLSRFRRSAYVAGFETQLAFHIVRFEGRDGLLILQELLKAHPQGWGRCMACFLTSIAEQAIIAGKLDLARTAAQAAIPLVTDDSPEKQRALLYKGAALIVTDDFAHGLEALHSVQRSALSPKDRELYLASLALAAKLRATPMLLTQSKLDASASGVPKHEHDFLPGERQAEAKEALASVDAMLAQAR